MMDKSELQRQMGFLMEIDKLKTVLRRAYISDSSRRENSAEHSWHMAMAAMVLAEYSVEKVDISKVIKMALVHDIVEVDAGDISIYLRKDDPGVAERERNAAKRIFGLLPPRQQEQFLAIQAEFDEGTTPEARFARALDRLLPVTLNYVTQGKTWREGGTTYEQVIGVNQRIKEASPDLWEHELSMINESVEKGYLRK